MIRLGGIFCILLADLVFCSDALQCTPKQPMRNFTNDVLAGTRYMIAQKNGFGIMKETQDCGRMHSTYVGDSWTFVLLYQNDDGRTDMGVEMGRMDPPAYWTTFYTAPNGQAKAYVVTIFGGKARTWAIAHSCNQDNGNEAVWLLYKERVEHFSALPEDIRQEVLKVLKDNQISPSELKDVMNNNCSCI